MTSFVTLWDEKYGVPESRSDARDFIEALEEQPEEANDNFDTFARLLADFAARANDIYTDDMLEKYSTFELSGQLPRAIEVEFAFDSIELIVFFHKAILTAAKHSRLVVHHDEAGWVLPDDDVDEILSAGWEEELRRAFAPPSVDDSPLPDSRDDIIEILAKMLRQHADVAGLKGIKVDDGYTVSFYTKSKAIDVKLDLFIEVVRRKGGQIGCFPKLYFGEVGEFTCSYIKFYELPYGTEPKPLPKRQRVTPEELVVRTMADLQRLADKCFEMFMYFYPHCRRRGDFYRLIVDNLSSPRFSRRFIINSICAYQPDYFEPDELCVLAQESRQPDYPALEAMYRESYIEHKQWERRETCLRHPKLEMCAPDCDDDYSRERLTEQFDYYQMAVRVEIEPHTKQTLIDFLRKREARVIREGRGTKYSLFRAMLENSDLDEGPYVLGYKLPDKLSEIKQQYKLIPKGATLLYYWPGTEDEHGDSLKEIREYVAKKGGVILWQK